MSMQCLQNENASLPKLFRPFSLKMEEQGMPSIVINVFKCYFSQLLYGAQGKMTEKEISPVEPKEIGDYDAIASYAAKGREMLGKAVMIKLNGGLGTSMGLEKAKSLIPVRNDECFLDIIRNQVLRLREKFGIEMPVVFMNSFKTHMDTMMRIEGVSNGRSRIPLAFVQHRYPKILVEDYRPATWPNNPELEWNPPGHGDIYTAMVTSKLLPKLLDGGFRYAFVSNSDNLGAIMDERILGFMAANGIPFLMEVADRTQADKKGGHLARFVKNGRLVLREVAQCPDNEIESFQDILRYQFFNTNNLWIDLEALEKVFVQHRMMPLDVIINPKTLDPRDADSPQVYQIETAMGSAISNFENASAVRVPRTRFAPVKTTGDLLLVMSDCYIRSEDETIVPSPERTSEMPRISLDGKFYKKVDEFLSRFPQGAPSLLKATSFKVEGDVLFEGGVVVNGDALVRNVGKEQVVVGAGTELSGEVLLG